MREAELVRLVEIVQHLSTVFGELAPVKDRLAAAPDAPAGMSTGSMSAEGRET